jgi:monoamine oxidase
MLGKVRTRLGRGGLIILAAFAVGCGGGDDYTSSGDETSTAATTADTTTEAVEPEVTQADFVNEADDLCKAKAEEVGKVVSDSIKAQKVAGSDETLTSKDLVEDAATKVADLTDELAALKREITEQLSGLETPDQEALDNLVKAREQSAKALDELADAWRAYGKNPTQETSDAISTAQDANVKTAAGDRKIAEKLGLTVCGAPVEPA